MQKSSCIPFIDYMARKVSLILALITMTSAASPFAIEHIIIEKPVEMRHAKGIALGPYGQAMEGVRVRVFDPNYFLTPRPPGWKRKSCGTNLPSKPRKLTAAFILTSGRENTKFD